MRRVGAAGTNPARMRRMNLSHVLRFTLERGTVTRGELQAALGLSSAAVTHLANELLRAGLLEEERLQPRAVRVGRPESGLRIAPRGVGALAVHLGPTRAVLGLCDALGQVIHREEHVYERPPGSEEALEEVAAHASRLLARAPSHLGRSPLAVGVGRPNIPWGPLDVEAQLRSSLGMPVAVDNNVRAMALADYLLGQRADAAMVFVYVGTGIGSAIMLDGKLWSGVTGRAGEIGHMLVVPDGPFCRCGNRGCLETVASEQALLDRYRQRRGVDQEISPAEIFDRCLAGDPDALEVVRLGAHYLSQALANLVSIVNPDLLVIAGRISRCGPLVFQVVEETIRQRSQSGTFERVRVEGPRLGEEPELRGAATLALDRYLYGAEFDPAWVTPREALEELRQEDQR